MFRSTKIPNKHIKLGSRDSSFNQTSSKCFFSLVEMLVVVAILAILMSILVPVLRNFIEEAKDVKCAANLKNVIWGTILYCDDNNSYYPSRRSGSRPDAMKWDGFDIRTQLRPYFGGKCGPEFVCSFYERRKFGILTTGLEELPLPSSEVGYDLVNGPNRMTYNFYPNASAVYSNGVDRIEELLKIGSVNIGFRGDSNTILGRNGSFESGLMWSDRLVLSARGWRVGVYNKPFDESGHRYYRGENGSSHIRGSAQKLVRRTHGHHSYDYEYSFSGKANWGYNDGSVNVRKWDFDPAPLGRNKMINTLWGGWVEDGRGGGMVPIFPNDR